MRSRLGLSIVLMLVVVLTTTSSTYAQSTRQKAKSKSDSTALEVKKQGKTVVDAARKEVPDSLPLTKKLKQSLPKRPDSIGVSYENGKWNLPKGQKPSTDLNFNKNDPTKSVKEAVKNLSAPDVDKLKKVDDPQLSKKIKSVDSLRNVASEIEKQLESVQGKIPDVQDVRSLKALQKLYDSLGISRIDSIRALMADKKEVSPEELASALRLSFPTTPGFLSNPSADPADQLKSEAMKEMQAPDLSSLKMSPEGMLQLPAIPAYKLPTDSIPLIDSLRKLNLASQRLTLKESELYENVKSSLLKKKPTFKDKTYFEGIFTYAKEQDVDLIQVSPSLAYRFNTSFSIGGGPNVLVQLKEKKLNATLGYRVFTKYEFLIFRQLGYLQAEDLVSPIAVSTIENSSTPHSILAGAGFIIPVMKSLGLNLCALYRVNNDNYSGGSASPWVVRIGFSSIKSSKIKP